MKNTRTFTTFLNVSTGNFERGFQFPLKVLNNPMEPIEIFKKTEDGTTWEYMVLLGHESDDVGFLVKINRRHFERLTGGASIARRGYQKMLSFLTEKAAVKIFHFTQL